MGWMTTRASSHTNRSVRKISTMPRASIRKAFPEDLGRLQTIARHTIDVNYRAFIEDERVDWFLSGPSDDYLRKNIDNATVIVVDGIVVGFTVCKSNVIDLIIIDDEFHRRGFGTALLRHCEGGMFEQYESISLESYEGNGKANSFYRRNGWTRKRVVSEAMSGGKKWILEKRRNR